MTEEEWLGEKDPTRLLKSLRRKMSARKKRLFAAACCNRVRHYLCDPELNALQTVEAFADGEATKKATQLAGHTAWISQNHPTSPLGIEGDSTFIVGFKSEFAESDAVQSNASYSVWFATFDDSHTAATDSARCAAGCIAYEFVASRPAAIQADWEAAELQERQMQTLLLRDLVANPFRPIVAEPAWLTPTVQSIAAAIYQDRAFDRLPILADALEEAGCTNADVLLHCRQPGEHVRGCWVVDLVLGKK